MTALHDVLRRAHFHEQSTGLMPGQRLHLLNKIPATAINTATEDIAPGDFVMNDIAASIHFLEERLINGRIDLNSILTHLQVLLGVG